MAILLVAREVSVSYPGAKSPLVLRGVSLEVKSGETLQVAGPSGSGKSSLLRVLCGLQPPSSGEVTICGHDFYRLPARRRASIRNRDIGILLQDPHFIPEFDIETNVSLPAVLGGLGRSAVRSRIRELLDHLGIGDCGRQRPHEISGGEARRAGIARLLVNDPRLLFADERSPTSMKRTSKWSRECCKGGCGMEQPSCWRAMCLLHFR